MTFYFFLQEGHIALVKKITIPSHAILEPKEKYQLPRTNMHWDLTLQRWVILRWWKPLTNSAMDSQCLRSSQQYLLWSPFLHHLLQSINCISMLTRGWVPGFGGNMCCVWVACMCGLMTWGGGGGAPCIEMRCMKDKFIFVIIICFFLVYSHISYGKYW